MVILDNASIHKSKKVQKYCEERNIILVYLPPYSPDLNAIEPLWKKTKRTFMKLQW
jgi:transposase